MIFGNGKLCFDFVKISFNLFVELVLNNAGAVLRSGDNGLCGFLNACAFKSGNLNNLAAELLGKPVDVDLASVFLTTSIMLIATTTGTPSSRAWVVR